MVKAPPFPPAWGFEELIGNNKTNIINASITAWKNSGKAINQTTGLPINPTETGMGAIIIFGMLPFIFGAIIYIRTQKMIPTTLTMLLTTAGLHMFDLVQGGFLRGLYIVTVFAFTFSLLYTFWNKE